MKSFIFKVFAGIKWERIFVVVVQNKENRNSQANSNQQAYQYNSSDDSRENRCFDSKGIPKHKTTGTKNTINDAIRVSFRFFL